MKTMKIVKTILTVVLVTVFAFSAFQIAKIYTENAKSDELNDKLIDSAVVIDKAPEKEEISDIDVSTQKNGAPIHVDFDVLKSQNKDIIAWVYCPDTVINYPIVKGSDNDYYLDHLIDGSYNPTGTLFADFNHAADFSDLNTMIYGHNMKNGTMLASILKYQNQDYYKEHPIWFLMTPDKNYKIELFSAFLTADDADVYYINNDQSKRDAELKKALTHSTFTTDVTVTDTDKLIAFSTCSYEYDNARFILMGALREIVE